MQNERQLSNSIQYINSPYGVRQRFLSASLSIAMTGTMTISMAAAHTTATTWNTPTATTVTHTVITPVVHPSLHSNVSPTLHAVQGYVSPVIHSTPTTQNHSTQTTQVPSHTQTSHAATNGTALLFHHSAAATTPVLPAKNDLDLNSATALFTAGTIANFTSISIVVGGKTEQVTLHSKLTAAELLATQQVLSGQKQTIDISKTGTAVGGSFNVNATSLAQLDSDLGGSIGALYIPHGVKLVDSVGTLSLSGTFTNYGSVVAGGATGKSTETIDAASILNAAGAKITAGSSPLNSLNLDASSLTNNGTISSSGTLNIAAGSVTNSSTISSANSDINFTSPQNITLTNTGGTIQAKNGDINFRTDAYTGSSNTTITGGALNSKNVNINGGHGAATANVTSVTGRVNTVADTAHITAASGNLNLGNQDIKEDPTYFNTNGNVTINGLIQTNGNDLAIVASGNIITGAYVNEGIDTSASGSGGDVTLIAGANFTSNGNSTGNNDASTTLTLSNSTNPGFGSKTGGYIDLSGIYAAKGMSAPLVTFRTNSNTDTAGNIEAIAYHGTGAHSGSVIFGGTSSDTQLVGASATQNGTLSIIGDGGQSATAPGTIQLGNVEASAVNIAAATPILLSTATVQDGTLTGAFVISSNNAQSLVQFSTLTAEHVNVLTANKVVGGIGTAPAINVSGYGGIAGTGSLQDANAGGGGTVQVSAGTGILINAIDASGGGGAGGSNINADGGGGGAGGSIVLTSTTGNIQTLGALNVSGGGGGGAAGSNGAAYTPGPGGASGTVNISTPGSIIIGSGIYAVTGAAGTSTNTTNGGAGGGSYGGGGGGGAAAANASGSGGGGGGGNYGGGGGGANNSDPDIVGGNGGSPITMSGGAAGVSGSGTVLMPAAGTDGAGGIGGANMFPPLGLPGIGTGVSGYGNGIQAPAATTSNPSGGVNLTFGAASYGATSKLPMTVDTSDLTFTATKSGASLSVANDSQVGRLTINGAIPLGTLTVNANGGNLVAQNVSAGVLNLTAARLIGVTGNLTASSSSTLNAPLITTNGAGIVTAPTLTLQSSGANQTVINVQLSTNSLTVQATGQSASVSLNEVASSANATSVLASSVGNAAGAGGFTMTSTQQVNLNGVINTNGGALSTGNINISETGASAIGIAINAAQTVVGTLGEIDLSVASGQSITDATAKILQAENFNFTGGNIGTATAPIAVKAITGVNNDTSAGGLNVSASTSTGSAYIRDTTPNALTLSNTGGGGQTLSLTTTSNALTILNSNYNNVTIADSLKTGVINIGSADGMTAATVGSGNGIVSITAGGNILQASSTSAIDGTRITLVSTAGSIGSISGAAPVEADAPVVSALASTGSVDIVGADSSTLSGSASMTGTNQFNAAFTGSILTSGTISGANVNLKSTLGLLTLGGNVTAATSNASGTSAVDLVGSIITQVAATTKVTGGTITLETPLGFAPAIGSSTIPIATAASNEIIVNGTTGGVAFIKQTGAVSLGASTAESLVLSSTGTIKVLGGTNIIDLTLNSTGLLTFGDGVTPGSIGTTDGSFNSTTGITVSDQFVFNVGTVNLNSGSGAIAINGTLTPTVFLGLNATGKANLSVTGTGTINLAAAESLELSAGGAITVGAAAANNPVLPVLQQTNLGTVQILANGVFTSPLSSLTVGASGNLTLQASSVVYNGTGAPTVFALTSGTMANPGSTTLNLSGNSNVTLSNSGIPIVKGVFSDFEVYSAGGLSGTGGTDFIGTLGILNVPDQTGFTLGSFLTLLGGAGLQIQGALDNKDSGGNYADVTLSGSTKAPFLVGGTPPSGTFNGITGAISGRGVNILDAAGVKISEMITATTDGIGLTTSNVSFATGGTLDAGNGNLFIYNPTGALIVGSSAASGTFANIGSVDIEAPKGALTIADSNLVNLMSTGTSAASLFDVTLVSGGALTLPLNTPSLNALDNLSINAGSNNFKNGFLLQAYYGNQGGSITFTSTAPIVVANSTVAKSVELSVAPLGTSGSNGSIILQSSGNLTVDGTYLYFGDTNQNESLTMVGTNIAISNLSNLSGGFGNLFITSNSATPFTIGAITAAQKVNGITFQTGANSLTAQMLVIGNSLGSVVGGSGLSTTTASLIATSELLLQAASGISGASATNLIVNTPILQANSGSGTVNLEVQGTNTTIGFGGASAGVAGTLNLQADDNVTFNNVSITASALNLTTANGGTLAGMFNTSAKTLSGFHNNENFGDNNNLTIADTNTGITTLGNFVGTNDTSGLVVSAAGSLSVTGTLSHLATTSLTAGGTAGNISFATAGKISNTASVDLVTLDASGTGIVSNAAGTGTTIAASTLDMSNGSGAAPTTALRVDVSDLSLAGPGGYNILQQSATSGEVISVTTLGSLKSLQYSGVNAAGGSITELDFSNIATTNGSIIIAAPASTIHVNGNLTTNAGSISILNSNINGNITLEPFATVYGSGTAAGVGQVTIAVGSIPTAATLAPGAPPSSLLIVNENGGKVTFGTTADTTGTITSMGTQNTATANGRNIIFSAGSGTITLAGSNNITADPPVGAIQTPAVFTDLAPSTATPFESISSNLNSNNSAVTTVGLPIGTSPAQPTSVSSTASSSLQTVSLMSAPTISPSSGSTISAPVFNTPHTAMFADTHEAAALATSSAGSQLPALVVNSQPAASVYEIGNNLSASRATSSNKTLVGGVANGARLDKGVTLISADRNQVLQTEYGSIGIAKDSLVLAVAFDRGIAVYNLHDSKRGAVTLSYLNHNIVLASGQHALLTERDVKYFEQINPINYVGYRNLDAKDLGDGVKSFHAEFDIYSLIKGLEPLKQMFSSTDIASRKTAQNALKTAALLAQMSNRAKQFELMNLAPTTAMVQEPITH